MFQVFSSLCHVLILGGDELVSIISNLNFSELNPADISNLSYHNSCGILNSNPVLVLDIFNIR